MRHYEWQSRTWEKKHFTEYGALIDNPRARAHPVSRINIGTVQNKIMCIHPMGVYSCPASPGYSPCHAQ